MALKADVEDRGMGYVQATKPTVAILPMVQNAVDGNFDGSGLAKLLADRRDARRASRSS